MKKELILESLIRVYLTEHSPVSSTQLRESCSLQLSASSIRNYFQQLNREGMIIKTHISSGRIPSKKAIYEFWSKNLTFNNIKIDSEKLKKGSELFDIFVMIKNSEKLSLTDVINVNNKFLILDFEKCEIVFRYSKELLQFFTQFKNYTFDEIKKVLFSLKCDTIIKKFRMERVENYNEKFLFRHYSFFEEKPIGDKDNLFNYFKRGLSFNEEYLSYKTDVLIDDQKKELLIVGTLFTDYLNFIEKIKEVTDE